jgi:hypothetical protein
MASLALSWVWGVAHDARVSAQEHRRAPSVDERIILRIFEREASLGRPLLDPRWSQPSDGFKAEIERLTAAAGNYRYDLEKGSHELLTRWLDERRRAAPQ